MNVPATKRMTRQRRVIFDAVASRKNHPSADEVYTIVRREIPNISLATVYRNLEVLSSEGLIKKVEFPSSPRRYDCVLEGHYHFNCVSCGRIVDVPQYKPKELEDRFRKLTGYKIMSHSLILNGYCPQCEHKRARKEI